MRKMLNKKGFSLVELMIVVVIMGILIAVAIPLYGAITENSKNKTCASNIDTIENAAAIYYTQEGELPADMAELESLVGFEDGTPICPWDEDNKNAYTISAPDAGSDAIVKVTCGNTHSDD